MRLWCRILTVLLQLSSLIRIVEGNIFATRGEDSSSTQPISTLSKVIHDLVQKVESEINEGWVVAAQAPSNSTAADDMNCLYATISMMDQTIPGGLVAPFESEMALLCLLGNGDECDLFFAPNFFVAAKLICEDVDGIFQTGDVYLCYDEFGTTGLGPDENVKMSNIPVCVSQICSGDTSLQRLLQLLYELASEDDKKFEKTLTGQCAPIEIEWRIPSTPFEEMIVKVGNTVVFNQGFNYGEFHNVYIHPTGNCDEVGRILVADSDGGGPASYTFKAEDAGSKLTFACDIGSHCEAGQIISFQVEESTTRSEPTVPTATPTPAPTLLPPEEFKTGMDNGEYDLILDVRSEVEWVKGHIVGATFADSLASFGNSIHSGAKPSDFAGCEFCTIAVYCRSGARARAAIQILLNHGFEGQLYNAQGIIQWEGAGFPLVTDDSVVPPCTTSEDDSCPGTLIPSSSPSDAPSEIPVLIVPIRKMVPRTTIKEALKIKRSIDGLEFVQGNRNGIRGGGARHLSSYYPRELRSSD